MNERERQRGWSVTPAPPSHPLPRYTEAEITTDPLERLFAQREAREQAAKDQVARGHTPQADPQDLRGIPCIARGVGGTSPHTDPYLCVQHWPER